MPAIQRMGDSNNAGGAINSIPQSTVYVNNKLVAVSGSIGTSHAPCPIPPHCAGQWQTVATQTTTFVENKLVVVDNDTDTCGHTRINGSADSFIG